MTIRQPVKHLLLRRLRCWFRGKARRLRGVRWDGHCWDGVEFEPFVRCVDCGKLEAV